MVLEITRFIKVFEDSTQIPLLHVHPRKYEMLSDLARGHLSQSLNVAHELEQLRKVLNNDLYDYSFGATDWCILNANKEITLITNGFDEFEPIEIKTKEIVNLLEGWYDFLLKYENGQIPGIIPENKKDEWIIVPKTDEDE